jgi:hypothetical protein
VLALEFGTCLAGLLDHEEGRMTLDDSFDARSLVPRHDDEACRVGSDAVVFSRRNLDRLYTCLRRALAVERKQLLHTMLPRSFLDPFVDRPEDLFVMGGRTGEIHEDHCSNSIEALPQ